MEMSKRKNRKTSNKYKSKKTKVGEVEFDSLMESKFYLYLLQLHNDGIVQSFEMQVKYELQPSFRKNGKLHRAITYIPDFVVTYADGHTEVVDVKGMETTDFKIKKKLFEYRYPELSLKCVTYSKIDGGWIDLDDLKKARQSRKKAKQRAGKD